MSRESNAYLVNAKIYEKSSDGSADAMHVIVDDGALATTSRRGAKTQIAPSPQPGTTAQLIIPANVNRIIASIHNKGSQVVYLGNDATVTAASFMVALAAGATFTDTSSNDAWYGITATGVASITGYAVS